MIDLSRYRLVDLSKKLVPGKVVGPLNDERRLEVRRFEFPPGEYMHEIDMESHIGTHVEVPSHFVPALYGRDAKDISQVSLNSFMGEAVYIDLSSKKLGEPVIIDDFQKEDVSSGDIVIIGNGPYSGEDFKKRNYPTKEAVMWLAKKPIKMFGADDTILFEDPEVAGVSLDLYATHIAFHTNDIPFIESMANLDKLRKKRFFFIALPVNIVGLESFPVRAVAFEPK